MGLVSCASSTSRCSMPPSEGRKATTRVFSASSSGTRAWLTMRSAIATDLGYARISSELTRSTSGSISVTGPTTAAGNSLASFIRARLLCSTERAGPTMTFRAPFSPEESAQGSARYSTVSRSSPPGNETMHACVRESLKPRTLARWPVMTIRGALVVDFPKRESVSCVSASAATTRSCSLPLWTRTLAPRRRSDMARSTD